MAENTKRSNIYMLPETSAKLDELAQAYGVSRSAWITLKINQEYDTLQGSPYVKKQLDILRKIQGLAKELADSSEPNGVSERDVRDPVSLT